eukprot:COSAG01_NODE_5377_length_4298_cov_2.455347_3_plen_207_part_00
MLGGLKGAVRSSVFSHLMAARRLLLVLSLLGGSRCPGPDGAGRRAGARGPGACVEALPTPRNASVRYESVETAPGVRLNVAVATLGGDGGGTGSAVLLLHGYPATSWFWRGVLDPLLVDPPLPAGGAPPPALPRLRSLWMPDQRGYNLSSQPGAVGAYNLTHLVEDAHALVRHIEASGGGGGGGHAPAGESTLEAVWLIMHDKNRK